MSLHDHPVILDAVVDWEKLCRRQWICLHDRIYYCYSDSCGCL